jgi:hypothetical protein
MAAVPGPGVDSPAADRAALEGIKKVVSGALFNESVRFALDKRLAKMVWPVSWAVSESGWGRVKEPSTIWIRPPV